jgi:hypothetical protein
MKLIKLIALAVFSIGLSACNQTFYASEQADSNAKQFATSSSEATIYIVRDEPSFSHAYTSVEINGNYLAHTRAQSYIATSVAPGVYTIAAGTDNSPEITINARPNENYFVIQEVNKGPQFVESDLNIVDADEGKRKVLMSKLLAQK